METKHTTSLSIWFMWIIAASFITYMFMIQNSISIMVPQLMRDFTIDTLGIGLLSSSYFYTYIIFQVPAGILIDWYKPRRVMTLSILIFTLGLIIFSIAHTVWLAALGRGIVGLGASAAVAGTLFVGLRYFPLSQFAFIAGASEMLGMFGGALGQIILAPSVLQLGWRDTLDICAAAGLGLALVTWLILKDHAPIHALPSTKPSLRCNFSYVLGIPQMWFIGLFASLTFAPLSAFGGLWAVPYLQELYGCNLSQAAIGSAMMFIGAGLGSPVIGYISDRLSKRRLPMGIAACSALFFSLVILYYPPVELFWMYVLIFLLGVSTCAYVIPFALAKDIVRPEVQGTAMGFTNMLCIAMGAPLLQPLIGWLLNIQNPSAISTTNVLFTIEDYHVALAVIPIVFMLGLICLLFIKETHCQLANTCEEGEIPIKYWA